VATFLGLLVFGHDDFNAHFGVVVASLSIFTASIAPLPRKGVLAARNPHVMMVP
jgi:hypothetical protein